MQPFSPFYSPFIPMLLGVLIPFIIIVVLWTIVLKGFALWHAARHGQKWWFIALLVINTVGLLEIIYLIWFRPTSPYARRKHSHSSHTPAHKSSSQA